MRITHEPVSGMDNIAPASAPWKD